MAPIITRSQCLLHTSRRSYALLSHATHTPHQTLLTHRHYTTTTLRHVPVTTSANTGALAGVRVLDFSRILAGPFCTQVLGDMGAEILKVEHPTTGDDTRTWGPPFVGAAQPLHPSSSTTTPPQQVPQSAYFLAVNRNKKSIAINIKSPAGKEIVYDLVRQCDVFIENFIPGKLDELGYGYEQLKAINPSLIYASMSGWGSTGPMANKPGYDVMASAMGGLMHITGSADRPAKAGVAITDICTGLYTHGAIIAALFARFKNGGKGQHIEASLLETQVAILANIGQNYHVDPTKTGRRLGTAHESIVPYQAFLCADQVYVIFGALNNRQFQRMAQFIGRPELADDPKYKNNGDRVAHREELISIIQSEVGKKTSKQFLSELSTTDIPHSPINSIDEVFANPQVQARDMIRHIEHPTIGDLKVTGIPVKFSETESDIRTPPPLLGQHTEEVLTDLLGYNSERLQQLHKEGTIRLNTI